MTQLHTVNSAQQLQMCERFLSEHDSVLLIEDAVYSLQDNTLNSIAENCSLYYLQADADARGVKPVNSELAAPQTYAGFVQLCVEHSKVINWF